MRSKRQAIIDEFIAALAADWQDKPENKRWLAENEAELRSKLHDDSTQSVYIEVDGDGVPSVIWRQFTQSCQEILDDVEKWQKAKTTLAQLRRFTEGRLAAESFIVTIGSLFVHESKPPE